LLRYAFAGVEDNVIYLHPEDKFYPEQKGLYSTFDFAGVTRLEDRPKVDQREFRRRHRRFLETHPDVKPL
jgi:hypothetical protein